MIRHPFTNSDFKDTRLSNRANRVLSAMTLAGSSVINRIFCTFTEKVAAYRMINNEKVSCASIIDAYRKSCKQQVQTNNCSHVLCIQDTCEINYEAHTLRMHKKGKKPGCVSNQETGCFLHPTLTIDSQTSMPLGFTSIKMWNREEGATPHSKGHAYKKMAPQEKESFRWCEAIDNTRELIGGEVAVTMLSDRKSDIYEVLKRADSAVRIIVRSNQNRHIKHHDAKLHDWIRALHPSGTYELFIPSSHGRRARLVRMEVRYASVELERPADAFNSSDANVRLNCICVSEVGGSASQDVKPIEWILLTNHEVNSVEQALQCVNWYKCRWFIEELFRLLKRKGFMIEDIELENTVSLEKNILFAAYAAIRCILLKHVFDHADYYKRLPAHGVFNREEVEVAEIMLLKLNGRTVKQQNPYPKGTLAWMAWIIARFGCWTGYITQSKPGYITFKNGLDRLDKYCDVYMIMKDVYKG